MKILISRKFYNDYLLQNPLFATFQFIKQYKKVIGYNPLFFFESIPEFIEKGRMPYPINWESTHADGSIWKKFTSGWSCIKRPVHPALQKVKNEILNSLGIGPKNKILSIQRESSVEITLKNLYPEINGYIVKNEVYLVDSSGKKVNDPKTQKGRRIDFVVIKGKVIKLIEVTSKTAQKKYQLEHENRVRSAGGTYIKVYGKIYDVSDIETEILRLE